MALYDDCYFASQKNLMRILLAVHLEKKCQFITLKKLFLGLLSLIDI